MDMASNLQSELRPTWYEGFPETRTLPGAWYLAELPRYERLEDSDGRSAVAAASGALAAEWVEHRPDPFPEPRTLPCGWDLSDVLALERERNN